jgi:hypothetical protein
VPVRLPPRGRHAEIGEVPLVSAPDPQQHHHFIPVGEDRFDLVLGVGELGKGPLDARRIVSVARLIAGRAGWVRPVEVIGQERIDARGIAGAVDLLDEAADQRLVLFLTRGRTGRARSRAGLTGSDGVEATWGKGGPGDEGNEQDGEDGDGPAGNRSSLRVAADADVGGRSAASYRLAPRPASRC